MRDEELNLKDLVNESLQQNSIMEVVHNRLIREVDNKHFHTKQECVLSILHLAMDCFEKVLWVEPTIKCRTF